MVDPRFSFRIDASDGAFRSDLDGSKHMLSPERSMEVQTLPGWDIVMAFDQLIKTTDPRAAQVEAMERSMRWARRSRAAFDALGNEGAIFGIQQGGLDLELRKASAEALRQI